MIWKICVRCKQSFSRLLESQMCIECVDKAQKAAQDRDDIMDLMGGRRPFEKWRFESFKRNRRNKEALDVMKGFKFRKQNVYLYGPVGCGKSHLTSALVYDHWERHDIMKEHMWCGKASQLLREFRKLDGPQEDERVRFYASLPLFVIDDFASERITEFGQSILLEVIDSRLTHKKNGLVINSNLSLNDLGNKMGDGRLVSRLYQLCTSISIEDRDRRMD
ncbi:MAG: ATP-binding protein [Nitrososphaerales archaeon]